MSNVHRSAAIGYATNAETYARGRPDYPPEVDQWLQSRLGIGHNQTVLDLGAGTGKFSRKLSATGAKVFAVDPVPAMLEQLSREQPLVETRLSSAESLPFESESLDVIVCAQSFHWFATHEALAEIRRVLKPGGRLGLIWNVRDETMEWVAALTRLMELHEGDAPRYRTSKWRSIFPANGFSALHEEKFSNEHIGSPEQVIIDRILSVSFIAALGRTEQKKLDSEMRQLIATSPELAGKSSVSFPYETVAFSCAKLTPDEDDPWPILERSTEPT